MGKNAAVGPHVKAILLDAHSEESTAPDAGKAEREAQVKDFWSPGFKLV